MTDIQSHSLTINTAMALLLATPIATALSRNAAFPLLIVFALLLALYVVRQPGGPNTLAIVARHSMSSKSNAPAGAIVLASILLAIASLLWSPGIERGCGTVAAMSVATLVTVFCCVLTVQHITIPVWLAWALPLVIASCCLLIVFEIKSGSPLRGALGASTEEFRLNRSTLSVALMLPLLFIVKSSGSRLFINLGVFVLVWIAAFTSISESAKLAVLVVNGTLILAFIVRSRRLVLFCGIGVLATHILAPFIATAMYKFIPPEAAASLSMALAQHPHHFIRLEIWWAYSQLILEAPVFGHGLQASRMAYETYVGSDTVMLGALIYGHPHNFSIQIWYEFGLVGVALSTALILLLLRFALRLPKRNQMILAALMAGVWSVAYVSHGAWQPWWWALVGIIAILFVVLKKCEEYRRFIKKLEASR